VNKRVLVLHFSQTGQLSNVARAITEPLERAANIDVVYECLKPVTRYPFPWPFFQFFDSFPETVHSDPVAIEPLSAQTEGHFDLIILAYQVWFLSPSQPMTAFLQSADAKRLLPNSTVMTVIACRNMWLMAQESMKQQLQDLNAHLIDNVVLTDATHSAATFFSTPMWMLTGNKGPFLYGLIPAAGVSSLDVQQASRFGEAIVAQLPQREANDRQPMLRELGAVTINERLIASERIAIRSFRIWGKLLRFTGKPGTLLRRFVLVSYILFLITLILTVVPLSAVIKRLLAPLMKQRIKQQREYFAMPSGEATNNTDT
jgi:hypothetical protein